MIIHHVQIAGPPGSEPVLRDFYRGVLGMAEKPKPPALAAPVKIIATTLHLLALRRETQQVP